MSVVQGWSLTLFSRVSELILTPFIRTFFKGLKKHKSSCHTFCCNKSTNNAWNKMIVLNRSLGYCKSMSEFIWNVRCHRKKAGHYGVTPDTFSMTTVLFFSPLQHRYYLQYTIIHLKIRWDNSKMQMLIQTFLYVVITESSAIFKLFPGKNQTLLIWWNS